MPVTYRDLDLETDVADALARWLDREPACRCVSTDREADTWACPSHGWPEGREGTR